MNSDTYCGLPYAGGVDQLSAIGASGPAQLALYGAIGGAALGAMIGGLGYHKAGTGAAWGAGIGAAVVVGSDVLIHAGAI